MFFCEHLLTLAFNIIPHAHFKFLLIFAFRLFSWVWAATQQPPQLTPAILLLAADLKQLSSFIVSLVPLSDQWVQNDSCAHFFSTVFPQTKENHADHNVGLLISMFFCVPTKQFFFKDRFCCVTRQKRGTRVYGYSVSLLLARSNLHGKKMDLNWSHACAHYHVFCTMQCIFACHYLVVSTSCPMFHSGIYFSTCCWRLNLSCSLSTLLAPGFASSLTKGKAATTAGISWLACLDDTLVGFQICSI